MKYYTFYRENNKFDDILTDPAIKSKIYYVSTWTQHLMISLDSTESTISYITLKYSDDMVDNLTKSFTPVPGVDYFPKRKN